ncbi:hypothetical protein HHK36_025198 [Tetracentron sinense]|uniref:Uncharacterized protein n=1 Tax=Tetracentron sinense TaxID=13715 RepID=A0A834YPM6_TETSI|nr:hypothetical protein HHK36_025198 [Tetracentron sinense]
MKVKNKGKVHPSPSSSSSLPSYSPNRDALSVLKLLPAALLALASVLSLEDREVLAYLITRSMKTTNPSSSMVEDKKKCKKPGTHKPPLFDCGCFDCYTSYWFRWDSSPNRELIHQAIEAFDEHLANGELSKKNGRGKKKDKMGRRVVEKPADRLEQAIMLEPEKDLEELDTFVPEPENSNMVPETDAFQLFASDTADEIEENKECHGGGEEEAETRNLPEAVVEVQCPANDSRGLARKVLPDVLGLFNSRLWGLWSPNV